MYYTHNQKGVNFNIYLTFKSDNVIKLPDILASLINL